MNPYNNLKSYTEANSKFFKGRDNEIEDVLAILKRSDVVVLYSESAEGKSSLLGAGLSPRFRQMGYIPVNIVFTNEEFQDPNPDFDKIIIGRIEDVLKRSNKDITEAESKPDTQRDGTYELTPPSYSKRVNESELYEWVSTTEINIAGDKEKARRLISNAWWLLRNFAVERYAARFHFVLIFDQFEEVFSHPNLEWTNSLFEWLEQLYSDKCPETISEILLDLYAKEEFVPSFNMCRSFKEIFSMRNEYIGDLDYWGVQKHFMPELKSSRYCLKPLTINEASDVIDLGFKDKPELKNQILSAVTGIDIDSISSTDANIARVQAMLLSIICSALSQSNSNRDYLSALKVGDKDVLQRIVYDVYRSLMQECKVSEGDRKKIEQALIDSNGKRVRIKATSPSLNNIDFVAKYKGALKRLGITRSSKINGEEYVELVHDQLANAIYHHEFKSKQIRRTVASVFLVMLACALFFCFWIRSNMSTDSKTINVDEINRYSLALVDENLKEDLTMSGSGSLENHSSVESYTVEGYSGNIQIHNNIKLKTLTIMPHEKDDDVTIDISGNILLQKVIIEDSVRNLVLRIDDNVGFCQIKIGKGTKNIEIAPRKEYTEIKSLDGNYKCINNRWWSYIDSTLLYIPEQFTKYRYFSFPFPINTAKYRYSEYMNIPQCGNTLDLSNHTQVNEIEDSAFKHSRYDSVILPKNLKRIRKEAFADCKNLRRIVIPASVTEIDETAFDDNCEVIFEREFSSDEIVINSDTVIGGVKLPQRRGTLDLSKYTQVNEIEYRAFNHSRYDSVILPKNLKYIRKEAFADCKNLRRIVIPASVTEIDETAFDDNCEVIFEREFSSDEIVINSDTVIGGVKLPQRRGTLDLSKYTQITTINTLAFNHSRYDSVILPKNLKRIKWAAFANCKNLRRIVIPASVTQIDLTEFDDNCEVIFERDWGFSADGLVSELPFIRTRYTCNYRGSCFRTDSLIVVNDMNCPRDIYFLFIGSVLNTGGFQCNPDSFLTDSVLVFSDNHNLDKIETIHISLPMPRIWTRSRGDSLFRSSEFYIDIPDSVKRGISLYVPFGSRKFYEESPKFKAFKEIREDNIINRYEDILFVRFIGCYYWFTAPMALTITLAGILLVVTFFFLSFKINYMKRHPYSSKMRSNILSAFNGIIMAIVATMGFIAVYWWIWDITHHKYLISALCGCIGAVSALAICYFKTLPTMGNLIYKRLISIFRTLKQLFY